MTKSKQGFTIIEVVLVLAIAGLIFLMVFVALPALQRSQRDTARRNDMSRVDTSLIQYQTNNQNTGNGDLPDPKGLKIHSFWSACKDGSFSVGCETQNGAPSTNEDVAKSFVQRYMNSGTDSSVNEFKDPDGTYYSVYIIRNINTRHHPTNGSGAGLDGVGSVWTMKDNKISILTEFDKHIVYIFPGGQCDGENVVKSAPRHFAVVYRLEGAGVYCIDDQ